MLKAVLIAVVLVNAILFAWTHGWLGPAPAVDSGREPERLQAQVRPDSIVLGVAGPEAPAAAPQPAPGSLCDAPAANAADEPRTWRRLAGAAPLRLPGAQPTPPPLSARLAACP